MSTGLDAVEGGVAAIDEDNGRRGNGNRNRNILTRSIPRRSKAIGYHPPFYPSLIASTCTSTFAGCSRIPISFTACNVFLCSLHILLHSCHYSTNFLSQCTVHYPSIYGKLPGRKTAPMTPNRHREFKADDYKRHTYTQDDKCRSEHPVKDFLTNADSLVSASCGLPQLHGIVYQIALNQPQHKQDFAMTSLCMQSHYVST